MINRNAQAHYALLSVLNLFIYAAVKNNNTITIF